MTGEGAPLGRIVHRLVHEPFVQFALIGFLIFGVYTLFERKTGGETSPTEIRLTLDDLGQLLLVFESKWRRPPTKDEFNALVEDRIKLDVLYREALALGLDKEDTIVKRRMAQKMQFLAEDVAAAQEPTADELRSWFAKNRDLFSMPARLSFRHLYFSTDRRGERAEGDAARALEGLAGQPENAEMAASIADAFMFQGYYADRTPSAIAREFGPEFATAVNKLKPGSWQGPVKSGYGWHLVFVDSAIPGRIPTFEEVEEEVKTAWLGKQKKEAWDKAYKEMRAKYQVLLPVPADDEAATAEETRSQDRAAQATGERP